MNLKFLYSEKATNFGEISIVDLSYVVMDKSTVEISQKFVAFSEYMNFNRLRLVSNILVFDYEVRLHLSETDINWVPKTVETIAQKGHWDLL